jgi:hypothetical protein
LLHAENVTGAHHGEVTSTCSSPACSASPLPDLGNVSAAGGGGCKPGWDSAPAKFEWMETLQSVGECAVGVCRSGPMRTPVHSPLHPPPLTSSSRSKVKPWQGKLPSPRCSPKLTLGDVLSMAQERRKPSYDDGRRVQGLKKAECTAVLVGPPEAASNLLPCLFGKAGDRANLQESLTSSFPDTRSHSLYVYGRRRFGRAQQLKLSPGIPYRPTPGLASLFARTGTWVTSARVVHSTLRKSATISYVDAARHTMVLGSDLGGHGSGRDHQQSGGASGYASGHQQHGGAGGFVAGQGQGSGFGRGGNQPMFHPSYGGGDQSLMRRGGGRGRHSFWRGGRGTSTRGRIIGDRAAQVQIRDGGSHRRSVPGGVVSRDGNGYPKPETRWVFTPLGYGFGSIFIPMGLLMGINLYPTGLWVRVCSYSTQTREPVGFLNPTKPSAYYHFIL